MSKAEVFIISDGENWVLIDASQKICKVEESPFILWLFYFEKFFMSHVKFHFLDPWGFNSTRKEAMLNIPFRPPLLTGDRRSEEYE